MEEYQQLTIIEQTIEMMGENEWYEEGIKDLSIVLKRNIKSIREAIKKLKEKNMITTQKNHNTLWIKHTLTDDELYSRMAFTSHMFCYPVSMQELEEELEKEILMLDEEAWIKEEELAKKYEENRNVELAIKKVSDRDFEKLADQIVVKTTYVNVNMSHREKISYELDVFRAEKLNDL